MTKMKLLIILQIFLYSFSIESNATRGQHISTVCESFAAGKIDAYKTLESLKINVDDYSIGVNNTAKLYCS